VESGLRKSTGVMAGTGEWEKSLVFLVMMNPEPLSSATIVIIQVI